MAEIRMYEEQDRNALIDLWTRCGLVRAWNNPNRDIDRKLSLADQGFLVLTQDTVLVGSVMVGYDGHRGWVYYLAVDTQYRGKGFGRQLMAAAEQYLLQRGCPKLNLQIRKDNKEIESFYQSLGFTEDQAVSYGKRLIADT